jgi:hypothetical protein
MIRAVARATIAREQGVDVARVPSLVLPDTKPLERYMERGPGGL